MRSLTRCGFTLFELLLGLVVLAIYAGAVVAVVRGAGRVATRSRGSLLAGRTVGSVRTFLGEELRDAGDSDVRLLSATRVALSRPIGEALVCGDSAGAVLLRDAAWQGTRLPQGGRDEVMLLVDAVAERWLRVAIDSVGTARCASDGAGATRLFVAPHRDTALLARVLEPVELSSYRSGPTDWYGLTPASHVSPVQPFAGPLEPGVASIATSSGLLTVTVPPAGASPVVVQTPLGSPP